MYYVPMTPAEIWIMIAVIAVISIACKIEARRNKREMVEKEERWEREREEEIRIWIEETLPKFYKEHPEVFDENGNIHGMPTGG